MPPTDPQRGQGRKPSCALRHGLIALAFLASLSGCGGSRTTKAKGPTAQVAPAVAHDLSFGFRGVDSGGTEGASSDFVKEALISAGYRLDESKDATTDATFWVRVKATERSSVLKVKVNGQVMRSYDFTVTLIAAQGARAGDHHSVRFSGSDGEIDAKALGLLVPQLSGSPRFTQFCREASIRSAETKRAADDVRASAKQSSDEKAWVSAKALQCRKPVRLDACEGVDAYLIAYPKGNHAGEALAALEEAQPHLDKLQDDENQWVRAQPGPCRRAPSRETCAGVDVYATKFPGGLHTAEAEELRARVPATP